MGPIDDDVSYQLIQVCKAHRQRGEAALAKLGLHVGQEQILFRLWEEDGLSQSQLAAGGCVDLSTTTKAVQRMEREGLVERRPDPDDARISCVYLTERGRSLCEPALRVWKELEERFLQGMNVTEQMLLRRLLQQAAVNLS
jgi:DNA-binding MarR family transcriptional regulator